MLEKNQNLGNITPPNILSVVMPAFNEEKTIAEVIRRVLNIPYLFELIVVDDCSTDQTGKIVKELAEQNSKIQYVCQKQNGGKTAALKTGFALTTGEIVIVQDADLELNPEEIENVIEPIIDGRASICYGSRFLVKGAHPALYFRHHLANKALSLFSNCLSNLNLTDVETCYKAFRGEIIRNMVITSKGFGFEIEATAKAAKLKCSVYEVPITYNRRTFEEGKKISMWDGMAALWYIVKFNLFCGIEKSFKEMPVFSKLEIKYNKINNASVNELQNKLTFLH
jgi:glycosyltransferase involved in cell wall biosynthesis